MRFVFWLCVDFSAHAFIQPKVSSRELNPEFLAARQPDQDAAPSPPAPKSITPGGPGSSWRMMRLRRVYETAEEENRTIEEIAIERFGTLHAFEEAKEERRILDEREGRRGAQKSAGQKGKGKARDADGEKHLIFNDIGTSGASSGSSTFRRPGTANDSAPGTPSPPSQNPPAKRRFDTLRLPSQAASPLQQSHTPIPTVMAPSVAMASTDRPISPSSLNKLQAKVLRARLMNAPNAEQLEQEYEEALRRANGEPGEPITRTKVEVLPTLDARGRLYDVGHGKSDELFPGNRKKKDKVMYLLLWFSVRDDCNTV